METLIRVKETQSVIAKSKDDHSCQMLFNNLVGNNKLPKSHISMLLRQLKINKGIEIELVIDDKIINSKIIK